MKLKFLILILSLCAMSTAFSQYDPDYNAGDDEDVRNLAFKDRLFTGGNFWANFGQFTNVEISPILGYRVTNDFGVGIGARYNYLRINTIPVYSTSIFGGTTFARYNIFRGFVAHAEFEMINLELQRTISASTREWVPIGLVGGGFTSNGFQIMVLYDLIDDPRNPFLGILGADSRLYLRAGFLFNL